MIPLLASILTNFNALFKYSFASAGLSSSKYVMPKAKHVEERIGDIESGKFNEEIQKLMAKSVDDLKKLYEKREIESE